MVELSEKALRVIEWLCLEATDPPEQLRDDIYKYVHIAIGRCKGDHSDWIKELESLFAHLSGAGQI